MSGHSPTSGRLTELLAGDATQANDPAEQAELDQLLPQAAAGEREQMMTAAGLAQVAFLMLDPAGQCTMPTALHGRLSQQADAWLAGHAPARNRG